MADETGKKRDIAITIAIITTVGTIIAAIITALVSINTEKMRQEVELTKIAAQNIKAIEENTPTKTPQPVTTATDTPLPSVVPSPIESGTVLFSDDFSSNSNSWETGSRDRNYNKQTREVVNGKYELNTFFYETSFAWVNVPDINLTDFYMTIDAEITQMSSKKDASVIITFRVTEQGNSTYAILFSNDNTVSLYVRELGVWRTIHTENSNAFTIAETAKNTFALRVDNQKYTVFSNGEELFTFKDNTIINAGEIGIGVLGQTDESIVVEFDNILITAE